MRLSADKVSITAEEKRRGRPPKDAVLSAADKSRRYRARHARTLSGIGLDSDRTERLAAILGLTGETAPGWIRRMIDEQFLNIDRKVDENT